MRVVRQQANVTTRARHAYQKCGAKCPQRGRPEVDIDTKLHDRRRGVGIIVDGLQERWVRLQPEYTAGPKGGLNAFPWIKPTPDTHVSARL